MIVKRLGVNGNKECHIAIEGCSEPPIFHSSSYHCFHIFNRFLYYSFISPYKVVPLENNHSVEIISPLWRKVAWTLLQLLATVIHCSSSRSSFTLKNSIKEEPSKLYIVTGEFAWLVGILYWPYQTIFHMSTIKSMYLKSFKLYKEHSKSKFKLEDWLVISVCVICIFQGLMFCYANTMGHIQLRSDQVNFGGIYVSVPQTPFLRISFLIFHNFIMMYSEISEWSMFLQCFVSCIVIFGVSKDFQHFIEQCEDSGYEKMIESYKTLKSFVDSVNQTSSLFILVVIINGMAEFSSYFTLIIGEDTKYTGGLFKWTLQIVLLIYFVCYFTAIGLAAEARAKFQKIHSVFLDKCTHDTSEGGKLDGIILQNDVAQSPLGVKAHQFTLSYSVMATILSTVFTYIFILVQLEADTPSHKNVSPNEIVH